MMMKPQWVVAALLAALAVPSVSFAEEKKAPEPDWKLAGNIALSSEYLYRGLKQTDGQPAVSGGFDLTHVSGFYLGNWNSNISWISDGVPGVSAPIEMDFYGGYKFEVVKDVTLDFGGLYYFYPKKGTIPSTVLKSPNTFEIYVAGGYGPATLKYSYATTELFGTIGTKNSSYLDLSASFDVGSGVSIAPHVGYQNVKTPSGYTGEKPSYIDYNVKVSYDLSGWTLGATAGSTNAKKSVYTGPVSGKNLGAAALVLSVSKSF